MNSVSHIDTEQFDKWFERDCCSHNLYQDAGEQAENEVTDWAVGRKDTNYRWGK